MSLKFLHKLLAIIYSLYISVGIVGGFKYYNREYNENDILNKLFGKKLDWKKQSPYITENDLDSLYFPKCPEQIHLSLGNTTSQMVVMWATKNSLTTVPIVKYGTNSALLLSENGTCASFLTVEKTSAAKFYHRVVLRDLLPNTSYYYQIVSDNCRSHLLSFTTFPLGEDWPSSFIVYGDMGRVPKSPILHQLRYEARHYKYNAIIHSGDFAYDLATLNGVKAWEKTYFNESKALLPILKKMEYFEYFTSSITFPNMGDAFMNQIQEMASKLPYMTCPGNHEMMESLLHYLHRFSMPGSGWPMKASRMWYSMNIGNIHFISYSTEVYFFTCNDSREHFDQYLWLKNDLIEANHPSNRTLHPWIIAFGHRPMYCSNSDFDDCTYNTSKVRFGLEELFFNFGVDLIIQAHEHSYERLWPLYKNRLWSKNYTNPRAPVHLIAGAAGCNEQFGVCIDPIINSRVEWSAFHTWLPGLYGYGRLKVLNKTHLQWQQVLGLNGQVIDEFWLIQEHHGPFEIWWNDKLENNEVVFFKNDVIVETLLNHSHCWPPFEDDTEE